MHGWIETQQKHAWNPSAPAKHQIAEIFVFRQKQPLLMLRACHDLGVGRRGCYFCHVDDIMPTTAQPPHQGGIHALVDEPAHGQP